MDFPVHYGAINMEYIQIVIDLYDKLPAWVEAITAIVAASTALTALTPTKTDNKIVDSVLGVLNFLAGNVLKNKNADAE